MHAASVQSHKSVSAPGSKAGSVHSAHSVKSEAVSHSSKSSAQKESVHSVEQAESVKELVAESVKSGSKVVSSTDSVKWRRMTEREQLDKYPFAM